LVSTASSLAAIFCPRFARSPPFDGGAESPTLYFGIEAKLKGWAMKTQLLGSLCALGAALMSSPGSAHHSGAMFDSAKNVSLTGTVRQFQWTNPHCFIQLMVRNDKGVDEEWSLEMTAPVHLQRLGWRKSSLKPGDRITVTIHPLRNGGTGGNVAAVVGPDGKPVGRPE
jgi:hypothetical protein